MKNNGVFQRFVSFFLAALILSSCTAVKVVEKDEWAGEEEKADNSVFSEDVLETVPDEERTVSVYSWDAVLFSGRAGECILDELSSLGINRVYQEIDFDVFTDGDIESVTDMLCKRGIETVALWGDRNWFSEGYSELFGKIDDLCSYNEKTSDTDLMIRYIALDVESYTLGAWKENPVESFALFTKQMTSVREYAAERGFKVIQVIPETYDLIDRDIFESFIKDCCDGISVMNYDKGFEKYGIYNEVMTARKYGKTVETIFETMPLNGYYSVTEYRTYYYDGTEPLFESVRMMEDTYGGDLGVSFHHISTLYHMMTDEFLVDIYPYASSDNFGTTKSGQPKKAGTLTVLSKEGFSFVGTPYWPFGKQGAHEYCFLVPGITKGTEYTLTLYDENMDIMGKPVKKIFDLPENDSHTEESLKLSA